MLGDLKKYVLNVNWLVLDKVITMFIGLVISVFIARHLGPENLGILAYAQTIVSLLSAIVTLGLSQIIVKELTCSSDNKLSLVVTSERLMYATAIIIIILLSPLFIYNEFDTQNLVNIICLLSIIFRSQSVYSSYLQAESKSKYEVFSNLLSLLFFSVTKLVMIYMNAGVVYFAVVFTLESILKLLFVKCFFYKISKNIQKGYFSSEIAKKMLKQSWPLIFSGIAVTIYMKIDQIMIANMIGQQELGIYSISVKLSEAWLFITVAITSSFSPRLFKTKKDCNSKYKKEFVRILMVLNFIAIGIAICTTLFSDYIINLLYGSEYYDSAAILNIYIWTNVFVFLNNGSWNWFVANQFQKYAMYRLIIGAVINVILNWYLINHIGLSGAAYASLISYFISSYVLNVISKKTRELFFLQTKSLLFIGVK